MKRRSLSIWIFLGSLVVAMLGYLFLPCPNTHPQNAMYGITWSKPYAESLGIDASAGLRATLDDLHVKYFRIPAYWTEVQPKQNNFYWTALSDQLNLIAAHDGKVILVVGAKQPRWPEFWIPQWAGALSEVEREKAQLNYIEETVKKFNTHPAVMAWQVENEASFPFGTGERQPDTFIEQEMDLVHRLSHYPVYTTDSGELSTWLGFHEHIDRLGVSVYRVINNRYIGRWRYTFLPPWFYVRKANLLAPWIKPIYVSEFQMEPWAETPLPLTPLDQQFHIFPLEQMEKNFSYAQKMELPAIYFWGTEWWYWMKTKMHHPEFWNAAKAFFTRNQAK